MNPVKLRAIEDRKDLRAVGEVWDQVFSRSHTRCPFMTHAFVRHWWSSFGSNQAVRVLIAEDTNGPCAIAPLACTRRSLGPLVYRSLELIGTGALWGIGTGLADRCDFLVSRRHEESVNAIVNGILDWKDWDVLNLRGVPAESLTGRVLSGRFAHSSYGLVSERRWRSPYLPLPRQFETYASARGKNFRKTLRRKRQQLEMRGEVSIDLDAAAHDPRAALARAAGICSRSWKGSRGVGLLMQPAVRQFLQRLLEDEEACAFLAELKVGETPVAYELDFHLDNKVWSYDCAYDRAYAHSSPGVLLTAAVIEDACRRGMSEYDFMRGDEAYKMWWTDLWREEMEYVLDAGTRRGQIARKLAFQARWRLRQNDTLVAAKVRATGLLNKLAQHVRQSH